MDRLIKIGMILCMFLLVIGCWDRVELEERGFVVGVGISQLDTDEKAKEEKLKEEGLIGEQAYDFTFQIVVPAGLTSPTQGGGDQKAFVNYTGAAESALDVTRDFANVASRSPYFEHMKVIIVSEELARTPNAFANILDFFLRDNEMRRRTKVLIAKDPQKILETEPGSEKIPVLYIDSLTENDYKNQSIVQLNRIGDIHERLLANQSYKLQLVTTKENKALLKGAAVFNGKDNQMVGTLTNKEVSGTNMLQGKVAGGVIKAGYKGRAVVFDIRSASSDIKGKVSDRENMKFTFEIKLDGFIEESFAMVDFSKRTQLMEIQKAIESEVKTMAEEAIAKSKDLSAEVIGISQYMERNHFDVWKEISDNWDSGENYFRKADIEVNVKVNVRSSGTLFKSSK